MANMEHLTHYREGAVHWNTWRAEQPVDLRPDLSGELLYGNDLNGIYFNGINLNDANLSDAELSCATLFGANLRKAGLNYAFLAMANLSEADLSGANLSEADLREANLSEANLSEANLSGADLREANLSRANLNEANLSGAVVFETIFSDLDLRGVRGLDTLVHTGPSTIGTDTLVRSQGDLPEAFLRGAGLPDPFITYARSFVQRPIKCFISYASKDQAFATRLHADLQQRGVRCWFASPEDLKIGDLFRQRIAESKRPSYKLILVLSEHSIASVWVEFEVKDALATEHSSDALVLFPVRLDDTIQHSTANWATHLQQMRQITDFTRWKQHDHYQKALSRLLRDLQQSGEQQRQVAPSP